MLATLRRVDIHHNEPLDRTLLTELARVRIILARPLRFAQTEPLVQSLPLSSHFHS